MSGLSLSLGLGLTALQTISDWLLRAGVWNDAGFWRDTSVWED